MSTTDEATTEPPATPIDPAPEGVTEPDTPEGAPERGNEAAKYRRQLRETETERDTLAATVANLQRAEVERLAGATLAQPGALWAAGTELTDLLGEDGTVDAAKVASAAEAARDSLGLAEPPRNPRPDFSQGAKPSEPTPPSWADALRG